MFVPTSLGLHRVEDLEQFEDDFELDEGVLVPKTGGKPRHGRVAARVCSVLSAFVRLHGLGTVYANNTAFVLQRNPDTLRCPDVAFVHAERVARQDPDAYYEGAPDLTVEVVSEQDRPGRLLHKVGQFLEADARLVWLVDPRRRHVVAWDAEGNVRVVGEHDTLNGGEVLPGFSCPAGDLFT